MNSLTKNILFVLAVLQTSICVAEPSECHWSNAPHIFKDSANLTLKTWDIPLSSYLFSNSLPDSRALIRYRTWVKANANPDPILLLQRQIPILDQNGFESLAKKNELLIQGKIGKITQMTCLEGLLLSEHTTKFPLEKIPAEFQVFILEKDSHLKIYFESNGDPTGQAPTDEDLNKLVQHKISSGWRFRIHLHNHPFVFSNSTGDIGGNTAPSGTSDSGDIRIFGLMVKQWELEQAWITNGFNSSRLSRGDIIRLNQLFP